MQREHVGHFADLSKGLLQVGMVAYIQAQLNFGGLSGEGFDLSFVDVDVEVRKMAEDIFEHPTRSIT